MAKETRLNDSAEIYSKRTQQTEKQKLREMSFSQKVQYFKDYYFKILLGSIVTIGFVTWILVTVLMPKKETILNAAVINDTWNAEKETTFINDLNKFFAINPKKQNIQFDTSYYITDKNPASMSTEEKLVTYIMANQIDVIITDEATFKKYAYNGYFSDLADQLPTNVYSKLSDYFYTSNTQSDKEQSAYGIYLDDSERFKELGSILKKPVIGIVANSKYRENGVKLIQYLYDLK
jgi:hypothetical protein